MKEALIFGGKEERLVSAMDIKNGFISKDHEFVDPEYEFKVIYVKGAKNGGMPHFRLYLSREDYNKLSPERKNKYDILRKMTYYKQSAWHSEWEEVLSHHMVIEKQIKDPETKKYKKADAFYEKGNLVVELQHSYMDNDFNVRNKFYSNLGYKTAWLFDLTQSTVSKGVGNTIEILEDNSRGFFRVCEECENIADYPVYIQVAGGLIYRVYSLKRKDIDGELKSTIRYFEQKEVFTSEEFVNHILSKEFCFSEEDDNFPRSLFTIYKENNISRECDFMLVVKNVKLDMEIIVQKDIKTNRLSEQYNSNDIGYQYCCFNPERNYYIKKSEKYYGLKKEYAFEEVWILLKKYDKKKK